MSIFDVLLKEGKKKQEKTGDSTRNSTDSSRRSSSRAWNEENYVRSYQLAREGRDDKEIARMLGVNPKVFRRWLTEKKALRKALEEARKETGNVGSFLDYVYGHLPERLKEVWDEITLAEEGHTSQERLEGLTSRGGKRAKQLLFLHALVCSDFNPSEACKRVGISYWEMRKWSKEQEFSEIMEQFHEHKKNFFEGQLVRLVRMGDSSATIFANRTANKDRGYGEKVGGSGPSVNMVNIEELNLSLDIRKAILEAVRAQETLQLGHKDVGGDVQDAEFQVIKEKVDGGNTQD